MKQIFLLLTIILLLPFVQQAQNVQKKKPLSFSDYDQWETLERQAISNDGNWVAFEVTPYKGDGKLHVFYQKKEKWQIFERGRSAKISPNSDYVAFTIKAQKDSIRKLKVKKAKKDKFPKDSLGIWVFKSKKTYKFAGLKSFSLPIENSSWLAFIIDSKDKKKKKASKNTPKIPELVIFNPVTEKEHRFKNVTEFSFSRNGNLLGFIQTEKDSITRSKVNIFDTNSETLINIFESEGIAKKVIMDNLGKKCAFLYTKKSKKYSLNTWEIGTFKSKAVVIDANSLEMPKDWALSKNGKIWFSRDDSKIYFGTAPKPTPRKKDTLLKEEKVDVDVWSWKDPYIQPRQKVLLRKELMRSYLSVYHFSSNKVVRLADELIQDTKTIMNGDSYFALGIANKPYLIETTWNYPYYKDVYIVNVNSGKKKLVLTKQQDFVGLSPFGNYIFWYDNVKRGWYALDHRKNKKTALTKDIPVNFYDEEHDQPHLPFSYKYAGWTKDDKYFLVYDQFDIWKVDPEGVEKPVCVTNGYGRKQNIQFRHIQLNKEDKYIDLQKPLFLSAFNKENKKSGYYQANVKTKANPKLLIYEDYYFYKPLKAKNADKLLWQKSSVKEYPNLWYGNIDLKKADKITWLNSQQKKFIWPTNELIKWKTFNGRNAEGLLYKPENYDPNKKYPVIVYFYDLWSDNLNRYIAPKPSRAQINPTFYSSNGYIVFIPNVRYEIGHPGKSAVDYVVSGTQALIDKGIADKDRIGIQGQSWSGYQLSYIITQTNMYAAAAASSPVSNMISAYGGIYWKTGISRMVLYEKSQSRLGASLWENPELYIENSPIFHLNKVETPLLIMHNDGDRSVTWNQGIELFMGLRRLQKPVWMLNYNGEPHYLKAKSPDNIDLSIRMMQFFNHYLKGKQQPKWMKSGIPLIKKGKNLGYELVE
ncbi:MAG: prolyl oligopeptidase family serine peptidase [Bacteroidota bacterium]